MIEIKNLSKLYGTKQALNDVNLVIPEGEIIGLFGENGAGKTTLLKSILQIHSYSGDVILDQNKLTRDRYSELSFATCEHTFFSRLTPKQHKMFYKENFPRFNELRFNILMEFFSLPMNKVLSSFSTGQKNQFEVIMALSQGAKYILMDEPFAGNDIFNREDFYKVLLGLLEPYETIILSTHLIDEVAGFIGRAILISGGQIIDDVTMLELEEQDISLSDYIKNKFCYEPSRVVKAIGQYLEEE